MWSGHLQLQITANCYQVKVQVLSVNSKGGGSIQKEPFIPDNKMQNKSVLPEYRKDGKKTDVPEVWLLYTNGNHYDALVKEDNPLITRGPINDVPVWNLNKNYENEEVSKIQKDELEKVVITEDSSDKKNKDANSLKDKLRKSENSAKLLEGNYKAAEVTIKELQTQNTMLKIQVKDLFEYVDLESKNRTQNQDDNKAKSDSSYDGDTEEGPWIKVKSRRKRKEYECEECKFPFTDRNKLQIHTMQHKKPKSSNKIGQKCSLCSSIFKSDKDLKTHVQSKHYADSEAWNCTECDFQGSNELTLN